MGKVTLVTDTTADLPEEVRKEGPVLVAPARVAFTDHNFSDREIAAGDFYRRMTESGETPLPSAPAEDEFRAVFEQGVSEAGNVVCLLMPFDMVPTFTTANGAGLSMRDTVKIVNPGVASAGLCSLVTSLCSGIDAGWDTEKVLTALDELAPRCDVLFAPANVQWLERAGRLALIEERLGPVEDGVPVVRAGTRITGVAIARSGEEALDRLVSAVGQRAGEGTPLVVTVDHAADPEAASRLVELARSRLNVARLVVTELSPTFGSQLGPGAVGIGVAPAVS